MSLSIVHRAGGQSPAYDSRQQRGRQVAWPGATLLDRETNGGNRSETCPVCFNVIPCSVFHPDDVRHGSAIRPNQNAERQSNRRGRARLPHAAPFHLKLSVPRKRRTEWPPLPRHSIRRLRSAIVAEAGLGMPHKKPKHDRSRPNPVPGLFMPMPRSRVRRL